MSEPVSSGSAGQGAQPGEAGPARRAASVQLAREGGGGGQGLMDPAHQSLAEALNVMLRLVQFGMIVLGVLFVFSGARTVKEGETGIRLLFGRVQAENLAPGFQFSWPYPIGDLEKVQTGSSRLDINDHTGFWPFLNENQKRQPIEQIMGAQQIDPARDGSLITADGNLAHAQWRVAFRVDPERASDYARNMPADEATRERIIRALAQRAIVHSVAEVSIDQLLKEAPRGEGSLAYTAQRRAQDMLDALGSGVSVESLDLQAKIPPLAARDSFNAVASSESSRKQKVEEARQQASKTLSETAGQAWQEANRLILEYEGATDARAAAVRDGDEREIGVWTQRQDQVLGVISQLFEGPSAGGRVSREINDAKLFRAAEGQRRRADVARFEAIRAQYARNPLVTVHREWSAAFAFMVSRDNTQVFLLPPGTSSLGLWINQDPEIARRIERDVKQRLTKEAADARERGLNSQEFKTNTNVSEMDGR